MTNLQIGFLGFAAIVALIALRVPVGLALLLVAMGGLSLIANTKIALSMLKVLRST